MTREEFYILLCKAENEDKHILIGESLREYLIKESKLYREGTGQYVGIINQLETGFTVTSYLGAKYPMQALIPYSDVSQALKTKNS